MGMFSVNKLANDGHQNATNVLQLSKTKKTHKE